MVGRGSFGEVYRAWDPHLEREVGLKLLLPRSAGDEEQFQTLLREARALAAVRHPNIVPVHGIDQHDGLVGFWTDFVHGKTLAALVREQGPFGYREAVLAGIDVCKALSAVHRAGLLHRDIKAENVMREEGGRILLMDFGLSALPHQQKDFAGTPLYMAPELFEGAPSTVASDIYAVGVLLFFLVTGKHPAGYTTSASGNVEPTAIGSDERTSDVASDPRRSPVKVWARSTVLDHRPDLPEHFARAVETATDPDPARRFPSAGAISSALSALLVEQPADSPAAPGRRSKKWLPYLVALGILLLAAAGFAYFRTSRAAPNSKSTSALNEQYLRAEALLQRSDKRQNVADATAMLKEILAKDPQFALAQAGLGQAYFSLYRESRAPELLDQARTACNRAIEIEPNLAPPYITLARIGAMAGNTALATQEIQRAIELDPHNPEAYGAQSEVFDAEGRGSDAIASVQRAIDLAPDYWRWPLLLGSYDFAAGKLNEATEQFRKATELTPDNAIAFLDLGLAQLQLERFDEARASLEKSATLEPSFSAFSALGELLSMQGKFPDAVEMYSKARDLNPGDYIAWGNLASGYLWNPGSHDQAMVAYAKAIELAEATRKQTPEDALLLAALGGYYAAVGKPSLSPPLLRQAVALQPDDPDVLFRAGEGYEIIHQRDPAIRLVARSIALGYHVSELNRSPELASLRADPKFQQALRAARAKDSLDKANQSR
jgi:serine/threonine protein kinase/Flp pilus assembly protein TadD